MMRPRAVRFCSLITAMLVLGVAAAPQVSPGFVMAGEDRTTATADDVVRVDADLDAGDYIWQATTLEASDDGDLLPFRLGFLVSISEPLNLITAAGSFSRLLPGQAVGVAAGDQVNVQTLSVTPGSFVSIELVLAEDATDLTAPAFPLEAGRHELSLQLFRPPPGDATEIRQLIQPILILVQSGEFSLEPLLATGTPSEEAAPLGPGDSASLLFDTRLRQSGDDPTAFFVATLDAPGSDAEGDSSAGPSSSSRASTAASPVRSANPSQAASPRSVTVRPAGTSARPSGAGPVFGRPSASSSGGPSPSAGDSPPRSGPSSKTAPSPQPKVLK